MCSIHIYKRCPSVHPVLRPVVVVVRPPSYVRPMWKVRQRMKIMNETQYGAKRSAWLRSIG